MQATLEQVHDIIIRNDGHQTAHIASFSEIRSASYSYTASWTSYHVALSDPDRSYLLLISPTPGDPRSCGAALPGSITLPALSALLTKILDTTTVPVPRPVAHGVEGKSHFGWLLLRTPGSSQTHPSASLASAREKLSPERLARVELELGTYLRALHGITNDWFGIPTDKPTPAPLSAPSLGALFAGSQTDGNGEGYDEDMTRYSWQDTFVLQLEELLEYACGNTEARSTPPPSDTVDLDVNELRRSLSRAIGSFLFDDVETPKLVWMTGNEEDVIVSLTQETSRKQCSDDGTPPGADNDVDVAYILPTFGHALWGDPLMEAWFLPPGPTSAISEGYFGGEKEGTLTVFKRHETKRVWYTVYLALIVLAEEKAGGKERERKSDRVTTQWARGILSECMKTLKDAPCY